MYPGANVTAKNQNEFVESVVKTIDGISEELYFIGSPTVIPAALNSRKNFEKPGLYKKTYLVIPVHILDLISSDKIKNRKLTKTFFKSVLQNLESNDLLDVSWRYITSADSAFVFTQALEDYLGNSEYHKKPFREAIREIIRRDGFSAEGVLGEIRFSGHDRKGIPAATVVKYVPLQNSSTKKLVEIPVDYRNPNAPTKEATEYRPLTSKDLGL
jgi:hypothetical protein